MMFNTLFAATLALVQIHVSPNGNDSADGSAACPVQTLTGARDAVRRARAKDPAAFAAAGAEIVLADGTYRLPAPLLLTAADGGTTNAPVIWRAAHRGKAVLSGGETLTAWRSVNDPKVLALLGDEARRHVRVADLTTKNPLPGFTNGGCGTPARICESPLTVYCDGCRLPVARGPEGNVFARTGPNVGQTETSHDSSFCRTGVFTFDSPRLANWAREPEIWMYGLWNYEWADATARVKGIDLAKKQISIDPEPLAFGIRVGAQFQVVNALSELDHPGEWVLDRTNRRIYCWLPKENAEVTVAFAPGLVRGENVSYVHFKDLDFLYARETALRLENARGCVVSGSVVAHTSSWGVQMHGARNCRVEGCDLFDLGEGGVEFSGGSFATLTSSDNVADNNHIHHFGNVVPNYRPGVQLSGVGARATHNLIHHTRHQAIAFAGNDHYIGYNVCHDCCTYNDDAGTIYCCQRDWTKRGTVIEHNLVHMTGKQPRTRATEAIYLDDFSSGVIVRDNIINRASIGVYIGGGQDCEVYGNLIFNCPRGVTLGSRGVETFARPVSNRGFDSNLFKGVRRVLEGPQAELWRRRYPHMEHVLGFADGCAAHNAHDNVITNNWLVGCGGIARDNWKNVSATCCVTDNVDSAVDPGVADYAGLDWAWRADSAAARRLGDLKFAEMGLYASPTRVSPPVRFGEGVSAPRPFGPECAVATVRIDVPFRGKFPADRTVCATNLVSCTVPDWGRGQRVVTGFGTADLQGWRTYSFSFTPTLSGPYELVTMGARGEKTLYDNIRVEGAVLVNGDFEDAGGWAVPKALDTRDYRYPMCNTRPPWGVLTAAEAKTAPASGARLFCGSDLINASQRISCQAGVPVTITFSARALPF